MSIARSLIHDFELEIPKTRKVLAVVPGERLEWKPHEKSMSLGQLAGHVAETPTWLGAILEDSMDFADMGDYRPFEPSDKQQLLAQFEDNVKLVAGALEGREDCFLEADWTMRKGDLVLSKEPRAKVVREILIHHPVHHRGQLTVYLRMLDVPVPSTFGPTADDPSF